MNQRIISVTNQLPVTLGIQLVIDQHKTMRQTLRSRVGNKSRAISMRIDPTVDLVFLSETTLPNSLPCLRRLVQQAAEGVWLHSVHLECSLPEPAAGRTAPSLAVLESGCCFLMAEEQKILVATFANHEQHPSHIAMQLLPPINLLDYLLAETFTVEISGINRRRLTRPLALSLVLNLGSQPPASAGAKRASHHPCVAT